TNQARRRGSRQAQRRREGRGVLIGFGDLECGPAPVAGPLAGFSRGLRHCVSIAAGRRGRRLRTRVVTFCGGICPQQRLCPGGPPHRGESHSKISKTDKHPARCGTPESAFPKTVYPCGPCQLSASTIIIEYKKSARGNLS